MKRLFVILSLFAICFLPLGGSLLKWGTFPKGYGDFPAQFVQAPPGFNLTIFLVCASIAAFIAVFLIFPGLFGFKKKAKTSSIFNVKPVHWAIIIIPVVISILAVFLFNMSKLYIVVTVIVTWLFFLGKYDLSPHAGDKKIPFPIWGWLSVPVFIISWIAMWSRIHFIIPLSEFSFVPLWWSFILILDGLVYVQNDGKSIVSEKPKVMQLLAVISCFSWFLFEYLNFFVMENWYYPNNKIFTNFGNIFWFSLSYTTVLPAIFEWYTLIKSFPFFNKRYADGPKISIPVWLIIFIYITGITLAFMMGYFPYQLFWMLWVCLLPALAAALALVGYKTPFSYIKIGDWTQICLVAIATLLNGFFWEFWNFGSNWFHQTAPVNPNFWKYSVPYVDIIHIFSEMPILGYWGYLFFGVNCWILWLLAAYICDFSPDFDVVK